MESSPAKYSSSMRVQSKDDLRVAMTRHLRPKSTHLKT
ncbi:hypothetical protein J3A66_000455 [Sphingomonas sp. PvP018]|nr:hypothetical protein [Sphingomonas sp. PvP018]